MIQKGLEVGLLQVNCYIVGDEGTGDAAVFDPGGDADRILKGWANILLTALNEAKQQPVDATEPNAME